MPTKTGERRTFAQRSARFLFSSLSSTILLRVRSVSNNHRVTVLRPQIIGSQYNLYAWTKFEERKTSHCVQRAVLEVLYLLNIWDKRWDLSGKEKKQKKGTKKSRLNKVKIGNPVEEAWQTGRNPFQKGGIYSRFLVNAWRQYIAIDCN